MFRPVKLNRITIQAPEENITAVMAILGDLRLLHLIRVEETHLGRMGYAADVNTALIGRYDAVLIRVNSLLGGLQVLDPVPILKRTPRPDKVIFQLEEDCAAIENNALAILEEKKRLTSASREYEAIIARLLLLEPAGLDLDRLAALHYTTFHAGLVPETNLQRLEASLGGIHHGLIPVLRTEGRVVLFAMALKEDEAALLRSLRSAFWDPLDLNAELHGSIPAALEQQRTEQEKTAQLLAELEGECADLARQFGSKLVSMREELLLGRQLLLAQEKFGRIDHTYLLSGWLPVSLFDELEQRVMQACSNKVLVERVDPEEVKEVRSGILSIPILFNNPALLRPFERLTTLYGTPTYEEVEPTGILALTFLLLFGMMFGDVGHGAVLGVLGFIVFKKMYRYVDYGIILMECGCSAMFFGILYGSVFGIEDIIPALWRHPLENIEYFMKVSAVIGIIMISTGLLLNLINIFRQHRYGDLFSVSGLAGAMLYWLVAALVLRYFLVGPPGPYEMDFAKAVGVLLITLMICQRPVRQLAARWNRRQQGHFPVKGIGVSFLESLVEVLDELLRYMANTVSFVRIAAFALAHAGLFIAVFTLADMVRTSQGSGFFYWLTLIVGNVVIIGLEGLVVSIQTVRLEYYEFFGKFFRGGGKPFEPILKEKQQGNDNGQP